MLTTMTGKDEKMNAAGIGRRTDAAYSRRAVRVWCAVRLPINKSIDRGIREFVHART